MRDALERNAVVPYPGGIRTGATRDRRWGKLTGIAAVIALDGVLFLILNFLHSQFLPVRVVLYDALLDAAVAGVLTAIACTLWVQHRSTVSREEMGLSLVVALLLTTLYALSIPTIIDRSLSVYMLEKLAQRGGAIRRDAFDEILKQEFFPEHRLVDIRLTEALNSGTVTVADGCVRLTPRGVMISDFTRFFRTTLLPKKREINGRFTDDLTDPFRKSFAIVPYKCGP